MEEGGNGDSFACAGEAECSTEPRYGAIVHSRIDETLLRGGRGQAVGLYSRFIWRGTIPLAGPAARGLSEGRNAQRSPLLSGWAALVPVPSGLFHLGHVPEVAFGSELGGLISIAWRTAFGASRPLPRVPVMVSFP